MPRCFLCPVFYGSLLVKVNWLWSQWFCLVCSGSVPQHARDPFDTIQCVRRVRGTRHSGNYKKVIPAGWLPSILERILPLFRVRWD